VSGEGSLKLGNMKIAATVKGLPLFNNSLGSVSFGTSTEIAIDLTVPAGKTRSFTGAAAPTGNVTVAEGGTLTIKAATVVSTTAKKIIVNGTLNLNSANVAPAGPITVKSGGEVVFGSDSGANGKLEIASAITGSTIKATLGTGVTKGTFEILAGGYIRDTTDKRKSWSVEAGGRGGAFVYTGTAEKAITLGPVVFRLMRLLCRF
jgi:hypothetical protein